MWGQNRLNPVREKNLALLPDDEVLAFHALAPRVPFSLSVGPGPQQVLALESQNHLHLEVFIGLHWNPNM